MIAETSSQVPVASLPERLWDVLVVGAGPAGATAAAHLSKFGYSVLMLEQNRFPRDKVCGDILIPDALRALERLGLLARVEALGHAIDVASVFSPSRIELEIPGRYVTLRRLRLDALIADAAVQAGATLGLGRADSLHVPDGSLTCQCVCGTRIRARMGLIATGANMKLLQGTDEPELRGGRAFAIRHYVRSPLPLNRLVFAYDRSTVPGYAWIAPLGDGIFNMGCGVIGSHSTRAKPDLRSLLARFSNEFPLARDLMDQAEILSPARGALLRCGLKLPSDRGLKNVLAVGETMAATYPFTGEGIGKAMETAELAASTIHTALQTGDDQLLRRFSEQVERVLRPRYMGYRAAQYWLSRPWLNDFVLRRASKSKFLQRAFAGIVDESVDPRVVFSWNGLWQSMWR